MASLLHSSRTRVTQGFLFVKCQLDAVNLGFSLLAALLALYTNDY
nr:MAG TPA: hypothetical protein [Caudoviricetes sp.]